MTKIKLCGMQKEAHIEWANEAGCDYIGFIFAPSRRQISRTVAANLRKRVSSSISVVGVFADESIEHIARIANEGTIDLIQLHGRENGAYLADLRSYCSLPIIKAVCNPPHTTERVPFPADFILLDGQKEVVERCSTGTKPQDMISQSFLQEDCIRVILPRQSERSVPTQSI